MKYRNYLFAFLALVVLVVAGFLLFSDGLSAKAQSSIKEVGVPFIVDNVFTVEDVSEFSPLPEHKEYLEVSQYASYCRDLQSSGRYSTNVYTNAFLSMKAYIAPEEVPVYDKFLKDAPTSSDPRTIVMNTIASNWKEHPELGKQGDMIMKIVSECK